MEVGMSLNALVRLPLSKSRSAHENGFFRTSTLSRSTSCSRRQQKKHLVVEAKGKKGVQSRQFQRTPPPGLPKIEDDGNPRFVIFIRTDSAEYLIDGVDPMEVPPTWLSVCRSKPDGYLVRGWFFFGLVFMVKVYLWYPLSLITGGTTAKIMVAAKDNLLGKYIYKDTIARNLAAVIYKDEKEIQKTAFRQYRVLRSATAFRYGYKLVENNDVRAALSSTNVIELPTQEELKTVVDKVMDFFSGAAGGAKESFGKLTALGSITNEESGEKSEVKG